MKVEDDSNDGGNVGTAKVPEGVLMKVEVEDRESNMRRGRGRG